MAKEPNDKQRVKRALSQYGKTVKRTDKAGRKYAVSITREKTGEKHRNGKPVYKEVKKRVSLERWKLEREMIRGEKSVDTFRDYLDYQKRKKETPRNDERREQLRDELESKLDERGVYHAFNHSIITEIEKIMDANGYMTLTTANGQVEITPEKVLALLDFINRVWKRYHKNFYDKEKRLKGDSPSILWAIRKGEKHFDLLFSETQFNDIDVELDFDDLLDTLT